MKSASVFLIHSFHHINKFRPNPHLPLRVNSIFNTASSSSTSLVSTFCKTYGRSKFLEISSRNLCYAHKEAAETTDERISLLKEMESSSLEGNDVGLSALIIGIHLYRLGEDPEKILYYAHKSLRALDVNDNKCSLLVAMAMQLIGTACYALNRLGDSARYLHRATQILEKLVAESDDDDNDVRAVLKAVHMVRDSVDDRMGEQEDAVEDSLNSLETKEKTLEEESKELGVANRSVADAFAAGLHFEAALPYALEALAIHRKELANNLAEVAQDRRLLGVIYGGLKEHDKALEQMQLLENRVGEIDDADVEVALGKYEEAISKGVAKQSKKEVEIRSIVLVAMSRALVKQRKFADSKKCLKFSCSVLKNKEKESPVEAAEAYSEITLQYESMNEFETAVVLLEKTLCILEKLSEEEEQQHSKGSVSARIGWLLLFLGRVSEAVAYLESAAERLKESVGPKHFSVGYVYNLLGAAYIELERPHQSAAQMFAAAKDIIMNDACQQSPSQLMPKFAVEFQQLVIDNWDNHGDRTKDEVKEVKRFLRGVTFESFKTKREDRSR